MKLVPSRIRRTILRIFRPIINSLGLISGSLLFAFLSHQVLAMDLQEYLGEIQKKNAIFKSYDIQIESSEDRRRAGDISLVPVFTAKGAITSDQTLPSYFGTKKDITEYSLGLSKKFSSGTSASVTAKASDYKVEGVATPYDRFATSALGVSLSQSLWKDFFGSSTRLRQSREEVVSQAEKSAIELSQKQLLIDSENTFWEYLSAQEDLKNKKASLERAKKIDQWVSRRASNGIADEADVLNSKALVATREYQVTTALDALITAEKSLKEGLSLKEQEPLPVLSGDLSQKRGLLVKEDSNKKVVRLDAYLSYLDARAKSLVSEEVTENYKPDLTLDGAYNTNVFDTKMSEATSNIAKSDKPTTSIGLRLSWLFDTDVRQSAVRSSSKEALAAKLKSERKLFESENSYLELKRKFAVLSAQVEAAQKIASIQARRARAEQDRFSKGRSITSTVVTAEQDASEAELNLVKLQIAQRKLEALSKLYVSFEERSL